MEGRRGKENESVAMTASVRDRKKKKGKKKTKNEQGNEDMGKREKIKG